MQQVNPISICVAGVTGWVGRVLAPAILTQKDLLLTSAVARKSSQKTVGETLACASPVEIRATVAEALAKDKFDVLVDYTSAEAVFENVRAAAAAGVHVVVGSSGITDDQFFFLDALARERSVGILAAGNFAITAVLAQVFACCAAKYVDSWEVIEYAHHDKIDAPSGTARELASRLAKVGPPKHIVAPESVIGDSRSRGASAAGTQVHSIRLPGFIISFETILGRNNERLSIRHDAGSGAEPYVGGTLLGIREVRKASGVRRGLDSILDLQLK